jgi:RNA polymerase sigma factor (sigma-70 family)
MLSRQEAEKLYCRWEYAAVGIARGFAASIRSHRQDLEQEARIACWKAALDYEPDHRSGATFETYMHPRVIWAMNDWLRRQKPVNLGGRGQSVDAMLFDWSLADELLMGVDTPLTAEQLDVRIAVGRLSQRQQQIATYRAYDRPFEEIARKFGTTGSTIFKEIRRIRTDLEHCRELACGTAVP